MKKLRLILGDQLNLNHSWFSDGSDSLYFIAEMRQETDYVTHHVQKVTAFFLAMRAFAKKLTDGGKQVIYYTLDDPSNLQDLRSNLTDLINQNDIEKFEYQMPDEYRLDQQLVSFCKELTIISEVFDTEHFLTSRKELATLFEGKKTYLMETFYREMRRKHNVLMEGSKPISGQWNYDKDNRKKLPKTIHIPKPMLFGHDAQQIVSMLKSHGVKTMGTMKNDILTWPVDKTEALEQCEYFCRELLSHFGDYQDALTTIDWSLFHSRISFALNVKIIHPLDIVRMVESAYHEDSSKVSLSQAEGFIRQIIGWREYMRGVYWAQMPSFATLNYFEHNLKLPLWFWTGETHMNCQKHAINQSLEQAYAHHIQRLMITGNFALLAGIDPDEVDEWYLGIYIDAIEWVEITNTRGMSQFADGGIVGTKPYVSSANYIQKMGNYCEGCKYDYSKKVGENACPFNSLYWNFYDRHKAKLERNPRIGMMYRTWDRMSSDNKADILQQAQDYLAILDEL